jgi:uncharacterized protein YggL (DUF469 family)
VLKLDKKYYNLVEKQSKYRPSDGKSLTLKIKGYFNPTECFNEYLDPREIEPIDENFNKLHDRILLTRNLLLSRLKLFHYLVASQLDLIALICLCVRGEWEPKSDYLPDMIDILKRGEKSNNNDTFFKLLIDQTHTLKLFGNNKEGIDYLNNIRNAFIHRSLDIDVISIRGEYLLTFFTFLPLQHREKLNEERDRLFKKLIETAPKDTVKFFNENGVSTNFFKDINIWLDRLIELYAFLEKNI